ncbi:hypothetical protein EXD82_10170 [Peptacetobacter hominis]|uniref:Uncharacterized protein n=1 Tax=Peptacetobacter hominis TaxID=2743610 RepID=A0A544QSW3_9FIRM|nr:hypothetical protein [Peptacetobacter hominis]TQQ82533.1 hypothetical protein EXD82_10170 [Peptacetobacter hominis]
MYTVLGEEVVESLEMAEKIALETDFNIDADITKSTKREDVIAIRFSISINDVPCDLKFSQDDDVIFNMYMDAAEEMMSEYLEGIFDMNRRFISGAYKWDEVTNSIYLIVVISDISLSYLKLKDVFNRLLRQND